MKRFAVFALFLSLVSLFSISAEAKVISANGFECSDDAGLVTCHGSFKRMWEWNEFTVRGYKAVMIETVGIEKATHKKASFSYDSVNGCLMIKIADKDGTWYKLLLFDVLGKSHELLTDPNDDMSEYNHFCPTNFKG